MSTGHALHKRYLIEQAEVARGLAWVAAHQGLLDEQLELLAREGVVFTDEEFEAAKREGRSLVTLPLREGQWAPAARPRTEMTVAALREAVTSGGSRA